MAQISRVNPVACDLDIIEQQSTTEARSSSGVATELGDGVQVSPEAETPPDNDDGEQSHIRSLLSDRKVLANMRAVAVKRLRNEPDAEDAVQTAALEALRSERRGADIPRGRLQSTRWLFGVARTISNNCHRRRTRIRARHVHQDEACLVTPRDAIDAVTPETRSDDRWALGTLLSSTSRSQRRLLFRAVDGTVPRSQQATLCRLRANGYQLVGRDKPTPRRGASPHQPRLLK